MGRENWKRCVRAGVVGGGDSSQHLCGGTAEKHGKPSDCKSESR